MEVNILKVDEFQKESEVVDYYNEYLKGIVGGRRQAISSTDGIYENQKIKILVEFKIDDNLRNKDHLIKSICQILGDIKKIENDSSIKGMPATTIFLGNKNNFCIFDSSKLEEYLQIDVKWEIPSKMYKNPPKILVEALNDFETSIYQRTDIPKLEHRIRNYEENNTGRKLVINHHNIKNVIDLYAASNIPNEKLSAHENLYLFINIIFKEYKEYKDDLDSITIQMHDKTKEIKINRINFDVFIESIQNIEKPNDKNMLLLKYDTLIETACRINHGEFYTPLIISQEAHKLIEKNLGPDCKQKYVWWDPCCGIGNLTVNYLFDKLYTSTLFKSNLAVMVGRHINNESIKFQYDFLNDNVIEDNNLDKYTNKLKEFAPDLLKSLENNEPIIIFMNPPYVQPGEMIDGSKNTKGTSYSIVNQLMKKEKLNKASNQQYTQFLYRCLLLKKKFNLTNLKLGVFLQPTFMKSTSFKNFRDLFNKEFTLVDSFLFNAGIFKGVSNIFGILFGLWSVGNDTRTSWDVQLKGIENNVIKDIGSTVIYNSDNLTTMLDYYNQNTQRMKYNTGLTVTDGLSIKNNTGKKYSDSIGFLNTGSYTGSFITSSYSDQSRRITKENFYVCVSWFASTILNVLPWTQFQNPLLKPDVDNIEYKTWINDCLIIFIFSNQARQDSMRRISYTPNKVINNFFWLSNTQINDLANKNDFEELLVDSNIRELKFGRYIYNELQKITLSNEAKIILNKGTSLVINSMNERKKFHKNNREWHLDCWDAGWYQIKKVLKNTDDISLKDEFKEFIELYKKFENSMCEGVYKFGFLK